MTYHQERENTLPALRHGISMLDGIELDVRLNDDGGLILHHDRTLMASQEFHDPSLSYVEEYQTDYLTSIGFTSFEQFISDNTVRNEWVNRGKMVCIEIKRPHPKSQQGGGYLGKQQHIDHVAKCIQQLDVLLEEHEIPSSNMMYYSFHKHMKASIKKSGTSRPWASLIPYVVPFGTRKFQRMKAFPSYVTTPFSRLAKKHLNDGASTLPCAIEYLTSPTNRITLGRSVGLTGRSLQRLHRYRQGLPMYVWPVRTPVEHAVIDAGLSALTDDVNPETTWLQNGHPRWVNPGTQPLQQKELVTLHSSTYEGHIKDIQALQSEVPTWLESDRKRKINLIEEWSKKWMIGEQRVQQAIESADEAIPWFSPRLIGHRGSGKTGHLVIR